jgi:uncharacterized coiled-coil protein SlyX
MSQSQKTLSELEKGVAERDDAVRQFEEDASAFTQKVESLTKTLAEREADYQVGTQSSDLECSV